jgi:hypothetical protein
MNGLGLRLMLTLASKAVIKVRRTRWAKASLAHPARTDGFRVVMIETAHFEQFRFTWFDYRRYCTR